ncbi:hypothetical protein DAETH_34420 (plasmid) [Deinococcus aetherius]|uniref:Uncharacterized protein n=1 Tax=Deinococcus aetherius TaxID=200252 RepID=A0ABN6RL26_9DEIO|nr:hypothetical protein DAETH_34420 [Deinococcus aetherius]
MFQAAGDALHMVLQGLPPWIFPAGAVTHKDGWRGCHARPPLIRLGAPELVKEMSGERSRRPGTFQYVGAMLPSCAPPVPEPSHPPVWVRRTPLS